MRMRTKEKLKKNTTKKLDINDRYSILSIVFALIGAIIFFQLFNLQVLKGKEYDELSQIKLLNERNIPAPRGNILDKDGVPIAVNRMGFIVQMFKTGLKSDELNNIILKIADIFEKNNDIYCNSLTKYITFNPIDYGSFLKQSESALTKWKNEMVVKQSDIDQMNTPVDIFNYLRKIKFKISDKYSDENAYKIMKVRYEMLIKGFSALNPLPLSKDAKRETVIELEERHSELEGVTTDVMPIRKYNEGLFASHIIGYVGNINADEYKKLKNQGYGMNDVLGKSGIEFAAENYLRGSAGQRRVDIDFEGLSKDELVNLPAIPGDNIILTLDMDLQKIAYESLEKTIQSIRQNADYRKNFGDANSGAVVALDVKTGEVLSMVSYPSFDPAIYLAASDNKEAQKEKMGLLNDSINSPMLNRAIQGAYVPGSTFKPLVAISGLQENIITPDTIIHDSGTEVIGGWKFTCLEYRKGLGAHGDLNLERALATSCNIYFHELAFRTGIESIDKWAKNFGLGELTGIDIPGEVKGMRANKQTKMQLRKDIWRPADTAQVGIGQFDNVFTPLQLANYIATIANGGKKYKPYIVKKVIKYDGTIISETFPSFDKVNINPQTIDAVKKGMVAVTNSEDGTAVSVFRDLPFQVAGKTGTPETGAEATHSSNALFVCYAPANDPKIAIAVVIEKGVWGANAAPVARDILKQYFGVNSKNAFGDEIDQEEVRFTN